MPSYTVSKPVLSGKHQYDCCSTPHICWAKAALCVPDHVPELILFYMTCPEGVDIYTSVGLTHRSGIF